MIVTLSGKRTDRNYYLDVKYFHNLVVELARLNLSWGLHANEEPNLALFAAMWGFSSSFFALVWMNILVQLKQKLVVRNLLLDRDAFIFELHQFIYLFPIWQDDDF